jgi:putative SOS response-associated peptidase YedK
MCVDIAYKLNSDTATIRKSIPGVRISASLENAGVNDHVQAHARPLMRIIRPDSSGTPEMTEMRWGLVTPYLLRSADNFKKYGNHLYNARSENLLDPASTWFRLRQNRGLLVCAGVYEHQRVEGMKNKQAWFIRPANEELFFLPVIYDQSALDTTLQDSITNSGDKQRIEVLHRMMNATTGELYGSAALITRKANSLMASIHNDGPNKHRMPLFLNNDQARQWLDADLKEENIRQLIDTQIDDDALRAWPVPSIRSPKSRPDGKMKHEQIE